MQGVSEKKPCTYASPTPRSSTQTNTTHCRRLLHVKGWQPGHFPPTLNLVISKDSSGILPINYLTPWGKSDYSTVQVNLALAELPAGSPPNLKLCYYKPNVQRLLRSAIGTAWTSIAPMTHINDQWCHMKNTILILQDCFFPFETA